MAEKTNSDDVRVSTDASSPKDNSNNRRLLSEELAESIDTSLEYQGVCRWYSPQKGYGFIEADNGALPADAWVHISNIQAEPNETHLTSGQRCSFRVQLKTSPSQGDKTRISAVNVVPGPLGEPQAEDKTPEETLHGVCLFFDKAKRFGFLEVDRKGLRKIFVHQDQIKGGIALREGQRARFVLRSAQGRLKAVRVVPEKFEEDPLSREVRKGVVTVFYEDRAFGFLREEDSDETHFFHLENISSRKTLVEDQEVKFRLRRKIGVKSSDKIEAFDVIPGAVRHKMVFKGVFRKIQRKDGFGFIEREDKLGQTKRYIFDFADLIKDDSGEQPEVKVGQTCTFTPKKDSKGRFRALYVSVEVEQLEDRDYLGFEPYLPNHFEMIQKLKVKAEKGKKKKVKQNSKEKSIEVEAVKPKSEKPKDAVAKKKAKSPKKAENELPVHLTAKTTRNKAKKKKTPKEQNKAQNTPSPQNGQTPEITQKPQKSEQLKKSSKNAKNGKNGKKSTQNVAKRKKAQKAKTKPQKGEKNSPQAIAPAGFLAFAFRWIRDLCKLR